MKIALKSCLLHLCILFNSSIFFSQVENVIVEKYYVSDANDFTDTIGGILPIGSTTYRIYIDLAPGSILKKIYGDPSHPFEIKSTEVFFNNIEDGKSFGERIIFQSLLSSTVALDSWLTLGQVFKKQSGITYNGILKNQDDDGSFIGLNGLLVNNDPSCGIPLTVADGIDSMTVTPTPTNWVYGSIITYNDTTIFGKLVPQKEFISTAFTLSNSGVTGVNPDSNQVIIAQLTTKGDLSFKINLELLELKNGVPTLVKYVAKDTLLDGAFFSPFLSYPQSCGCNDPDFLEYSSSYVCYLEGSCQTLVKIGCMDSMACNYDPEVNLNIENLCCYPGKCNNRDIAVVCPELRGDSFEFLLHPNPVNETLYLDVYSGFLAPITYTIFNTFGVKIIEKTLDPALIITGEAIETSSLDYGLYHIQVEIGNIVLTQLFIKN